MKYELKELSFDMADDIYDMYQDIPNGENGQTNNAYGLDKDEFESYIKEQIKRKDNSVTLDDTPTITYIMFVNDIPVGYICLRTKIDENWKKWSGNFYYQVRKSQRQKGYATKMLGLGLNELKRLGFKKAYGQSSKGNVASSKVIENNGGIMIDEIEGTKYYMIEL